MKYILTLIFLLLGHSAIAQNHSAPVTQVQLEKLKKDIILHTPESPFNKYQLHRISEITMTDTISRSEKTTTILYTGKTGKVLQVQTTWGGPCGKETANIIYFNNNGLKEYEEEQSCLTADSADSIDHWAFFSARTFHRYEYDSLNRVKKEVFHMPTIVTNRTNLTYNAKGVATAISIKIKREEFWD